MFYSGADSESEEQTMRITTQILNQTAKKSGIAINQNSLLNYINKDDSSTADSLYGLADGIGTSTKTAKTDTVTTRQYQKTKEAAEKLKEAAKQLTDSSSALYEDAAESKDTSKITDKVNGLIEAYNQTLSSLNKSSSALDNLYRNSLKELPEEMADLLGSVGITQNKDGSLSVDAEKLNAADADTLKQIFGSGSKFTERLSFLAGRIEENTVASLSDISSTYSQKGTVLSRMGSIYNMLG